MTGINHDDTIAKCQRRPEQQRLNIFLQIHAMNENLVVNDSGAKPRLTTVSFKLLRGCRFPMQSCRSANSLHIAARACRTTDAAR